MKTTVINNLRKYNSIISLLIIITLQLDYSALVGTAASRRGCAFSANHQLL